MPSLSIATPPLDGMLVSQDYPQQYVAHTNLYMYTWVKWDKVE